VRGVMDNYFTDGQNVKSINTLVNVPEAWTWLQGGPMEDEGLKKLQKTVPWLYRGLQLRMNAVSTVPYVIYKGEEVWDSSDDWQNKLGWWSNPRKSIMLAEGALTLFGKAYFFKEPNRLNKPMDLRYWFPLTVDPVITEGEGLTGFKRKLKGQPEAMPFEVRDLLYIWGIDPFVEIGPPGGSPATAALQAAGVLWNVDEFAAAFFERGAIKATILSVPQGTIESERSRLKEWWQRAVQGKNFATEVVNADAVKAETIGEGIKELENTELTKEKREDIATALGIPQSKMFSTSATDSNREEDEKSMVEDVSIPECRLIEEALNQQIFRDLGLRFSFQPEAMGVYQEDEQQRSTAFMNYVNATGKDKASIWAKFLGLQMPEGMEFEDLDSEQMPVPDFTPNKEVDEEKEEERKQFYRWAKKRVPKDWHKFKFHYLDKEEQLDLVGDKDDNGELTKALTAVIDQLRSEREPINITVNLPEDK